MLYSQHCKDANSALSKYAEQRTHDRKGVTIPSQRRYVQYYARLLESNRKYEAVPLKVKKQARSINNTHFPRERGDLCEIA